MLRPVAVVIGLIFFPAPRSWRAKTGREGSGRPDAPSSAARAALDGASGRPLPSLPVFARHDRGAGKKIKPITTATGRNIVNQRVGEASGASSQDKDLADAITPHSFRHYFVTAVLRGSGGNLKLAQELARHKNIAVTQRYAHLSNDELDQGYWEIFEK